MSHDLEALAGGLGGFTHPSRMRLMLLLEDQQSPKAPHELVGEFASLASVPITCAKCSAPR